MKEFILEFLNEIPYSGKILLVLFFLGLEYSIFKPFFGTDYFNYQPIINTIIMIGFATFIGTLIYYLTFSILKND